MTTNRHNLNVEKGKQGFQETRKSAASVPSGGLGASAIGGDSSYVMPDAERAKVMTSLNNHIPMARSISFRNTPDGIVIDSMEMQMGPVARTYSADDMGTIATRYATGVLERNLSEDSKAVESLMVRA